MVSHYKTERAETVIARIASINGQRRPDVSKLIEITRREAEVKEDKRYSLLDIFSDRTLLKHSILLWFIW